MCGPAVSRVALGQQPLVDPYPQLVIKQAGVQQAQQQPQQPAGLGPAYVANHMLARHEAGAAAGASCAIASPAVSPRSACSTPGGVDHCMGAQLHALVFGSAAAHNQQAAQQGAVRQQENLLLLQQRRRLPQRNCTSRDLRRTSTQEPGNPYASSAHYRQGTGMLQSVAALGLHGHDSYAVRSCRGSISKAKQVLAEAINSIPGAHGFGNGIAPVTCDTGVLSPLLTIIRNNGCVSRRSSFGEHSVCSAASSSSLSSASSGSGGSSGLSSPPAPLPPAPLSPVGGSATAGRQPGGSSRLSRYSYSSGEPASGDSSSSLGLPSSALPEHEPAPAPAADDDCCYLQQLEAQQQRQAAARTHKVVDCIDTVRYLCMDDSNRAALIDLGAVELLLGKLRPSPAAADGAPEVAVAALGALAVLAKYDGMKQRLWDAPDSAVLLQLLASRQASLVVRAAHGAVAQLGWTSDVSSSSSCGASSGAGSIFDGVSSAYGSSGCSSASSTCSGANELLAPALVPALASCLHPAADVPVLLSALKLLTKAAGTCGLDGSSTPRSPLGQQQAQQQSVLRTGWRQVVFAVMPLLIPTHRRQGAAVLSAALELLVVLTEQQSDLHNTVVAAGCLAPLLALLSSSCSENCLQSACILTGLVDVPAAQQKLAAEPGALAALLRLLPDSGRSVDVRLAAVHMLRRLAESAPGCLELLKAHCAVPAVVALHREVHDSDVRRAATGLLQLLGTTVVFKKHARRSMDAPPGRKSSSHRASSLEAAAAQRAAQLCLA